MQLTRTEYERLRLLAVSAGRVSTYDSLLRQVWEGRANDPKLVRTVVKNLRRKLGDDTASPVYVVTERGVGYRMGRPGDLYAVVGQWLGPVSRWRLTATAGCGATPARPISASGRSRSDCWSVRLRSRSRACCQSEIRYVLRINGRGADLPRVVLQRQNDEKGLGPRMEFRLPVGDLCGGSDPASSSTCGSPTAPSRSRPARFNPGTGQHQHGPFPQKAGDNLTVRNFRKVCLGETKEGLIYQRTSRIFEIAV